jgi:hypothetical protein
MSRSICWESNHGGVLSSPGSEGTDVYYLRPQALLNAGSMSLSIDLRFGLGDTELKTAQ